MKTFKDLEFNKHKLSEDEQHARMDFENGYGISVITLFYLDEDAPYEAAIMRGGHIWFEADIADITHNPINGINGEQVTEIMVKIQNLEKIEPKPEEEQSTSTDKIDLCVQPFLSRGHDKVHKEFRITWDVNGKEHGFCDIYQMDEFNGTFMKMWKTAAGFIHKEFIKHMKAKRHESAPAS